MGVFVLRSRQKNNFWPFLRIQPVYLWLHFCGMWSCQHIFAASHVWFCLCRLAMNRTFHGNLSSTANLGSSFWNSCSYWTNTWSTMLQSISLHFWGTHRLRATRNWAAAAHFYVSFSFCLVCLLHHDPCAFEITWHRTDWWLVSSLLCFYGWLIDLNPCSCHL